jgi:predicted short-subunit dehydrogenase-like oxidoreductase (DUF2520 family)
VKTIILSDEDAAQVKAIMLTHAEMTDQRSMSTEAEHGRVSRDDPGDLETLEDLREEVNDCDEDTINLKRIAALFD